MPKYIYKCKKHTFEIKQNYDDKPLSKCKCGRKCQRVINITPIIFKGKGFYITDNYN